VHFDPRLYVIFMLYCMADKLGAMCDIYLEFSCKNICSISLSAWLVIPFRLINALTTFIHLIDDVECVSPSLQESQQSAFKKLN
jgi:hypothetical protein